MSDWIRKLCVKYIQSDVSCSILNCTYGIKFSIFDVSSLFVMNGFGATVGSLFFPFFDIMLEISSVFYVL